MKHIRDHTYFSRRRVTRLAVLGLWLVGLVVFWWLLQSRELGPLALMHVGLGVISNSLGGAAILLGLYLLRPLLLFPATPLLVIAGFAFGPLTGTLYALVAGTLSAAVAYGLGRYAVSGSALDGLDPAFLRRLRRRPFETVLLGRLIFLPGDLINYSCGILAVGLQPFLAATLLGSLPGSLAAALFGASLEGELGAWPELDVTTLLVSLAIFAASLLLARRLRRAERPRR